MVSGRVVWCLVTSLLLVSCIAMAAIGVLIWKFVSEDADCRDEENLQQLFPGYFRTSLEQTKFIGRYPRAVNSPRTVRPARCSFKCPAEESTLIINPIPTTPNSTGPRFLRKKRADSKRLLPEFSDVETYDSARLRSKRAPDDDVNILSGPIYHSCCASWRIESKLEVATTVEGIEVEVVQTPLFGQYFEEEHCESYESCNAECTCDTTKYVTSAVVYKDKNARKIKDRYEIAFLVLDGCCKCLNLASPGQI